jgi:hypothetical protein
MHVGVSSNRNRARIINVICVEFAVWNSYFKRQTVLCERNHARDKSVEIRVFSDVTPCSLVDGYERLGGRHVTSVFAGKWRQQLLRNAVFRTKPNHTPEERTPRTCWLGDTPLAMYSVTLCSDIAWYLIVLQVAHSENSRCFVESFTMNYLDILWSVSRCSVSISCPSFHGDFSRYFVGGSTVNSFHIFAALHCMLCRYIFGHLTVGLPDAWYAASWRILSIYCSRAYRDGPSQHFVRLVTKPFLTTCCSAWWQLRQLQ